MKENISILISEDKIQKRVSEIAEQISNDFTEESVTLICILKGAVMFMVDLARKINKNVEIDFMDVSSYGERTESSGNIKINKDLQNPIEGKNIIIVEDIIDSGRTLNYLYRYLKDKKPASLKICTLLDKPERRVFDIKVDYTGFTIPDEFIVGYGLDYAEKYRNFPYIGVLRQEKSK